MRLSRNAVVLITLVYLFTGLFFFSYRYLEEGANNRWPDWRPPFLNEMSAALASYILFWPLFWFTNRYPFVRGRRWKHIGFYVLALFAWSFLHTTMLATMRPVLYQLVLGKRFDYGYLPVRYLMEFSIGAFVFWAQVGAISAFRFQQELRNREVRTAQLERELTQAHLDALRLQLRPHFLFNALNAVSSVMYEDPRKADRMITSLSDFLRAVLRQESTHTVTLEEELRLLDQYLAIMQVRFGDRLTFTRSVPDALLPALVPPLLLQPLVENCVQHGVHPATGELVIHLEIRAEGDALHLSVRDHGQGLDAPVAEAAAEGSRVGLGLTNTRRRLERLYGQQQQFLLTNAGDAHAAGTGALASIVLPLTLEETEPAHAL
ncbi:MAG: histidine kinase [Bryobacterales bacterium]|nr:histidine kinase [Bryobacterales bacterium]